MKLVLTALVMTFIVGGLALVNSMYFSEGQPEPAIVINSDGTITPSTAPIRRTDNTYTLTGDLNKELWVDKSNVVLDGNGYHSNRLIAASVESNITIQHLSINSGQDILLVDVSNVSIINNTLIGGDSPWYEIGAISIADCSSISIIGNTISNGDIGILITGSQDILIVRNNITSTSTGWDHASAGIILYDSSNNTIYHNNFINNTRGVGIRSSINNTWDNGYPSGGNYWDEYQSKYPNASEIDNSGIWNIPYVIDTNNTDYHPLINQVDITMMLSTPTPLPTTTPSPTPTPSIPELPIWITIFIVIAVTSVTMAYLMKKQN